MLKAAIIGCGRIGAGIGDWPRTEFIYDHASTYKALESRVALSWVFDVDPVRALEAGNKFSVNSAGGNGWKPLLAHMMKEHPVEIVSLCVPPQNQAEVFEQLLAFESIRGVWIEKPFMVRAWPTSWKIQVNYIRRFDRTHCEIALNHWMWIISLDIKAKKDIHTVCHFTDLARFWQVNQERFHFTEFNGPCSYNVRLSFMPGVMDLSFKNGGVEGGFMETALGNLIDALEGKADLWSAPENAVESEKWAMDILGAGHGG